MSDMLLMMKDIVVMKINFDEGIYDVVDDKHLPFLLQGALRNAPSYEEDSSKYGETQRMIARDKNKWRIIDWLSSRVLPLSRDNAKKIYSLLKLSQRQDEYYKARIALMCRAVSLQDNYWVKSENDRRQWKDVDLRTNHLNEVITQVSLHGSSLTLQGELTTPELTGQGAYAKAWKREPDGYLWLYKKGSKDPTESRIEVMVSNLLDKCNVKHIHYELAESSGGIEGTVLCCRCKCMTTDKINILPAMDFNSYCLRNGLNFTDECLKIDADSIYKMWIVDYLTANRDRHDMNWGFFFDCDENKILGCHPLFDHNNAFDRDFMSNDDSPYQAVEDMTMKEAAMLAMNHVDFHFTGNITREDFITDRQYECFLRRAKQLGIRKVG